MRIYHDWEFLEDGKQIHPIAVAMCDDGGRELYHVFEEIESDPLYGLICRHRWLMDHVVPMLPLEPGTNVVLPGGLFRGSFSLNLADNRVTSTRHIRNAVRDFLLPPGGADWEPELWGWYSGYDHVCLAQLFGRMVDLPEGIPMFTRDLRQRQDQFKLADEALPGYSDKGHDPLEEVRLMREWAEHMDGLEIAGQGYSLSE